MKFTIVCQSKAAIIMKRIDTHSEQRKGKNIDNIKIHKILSPYLCNQSCFLFRIGVGNLLFQRMSFASGICQRRHKNICLDCCLGKCISIDGMRAFPDDERPSASQTSGRIVEAGTTHCMQIQRAYLQQFKSAQHCAGRRYVVRSIFEHRKTGRKRHYMGSGTGFGSAGSCLCCAGKCIHIIYEKLYDHIFPGGSVLPKYLQENLCGGEGTG